MCSYCILCCLSVLHQTVASDFLLHIMKWGTHIINSMYFLSKFCGYFRMEIWDFNVLTVVGLMFTNNSIGIFSLQKHRCYLMNNWGMSGHFSVRGEPQLLFKDKFVSFWEELSWCKQICSNYNTCFSTGIKQSESLLWLEVIFANQFKCFLIATSALSRNTHCYNRAINKLFRLDIAHFPHPTIHCQICLKKGLEVLRVGRADKKT